MQNLFKPFPEISFIIFLCIFFYIPLNISLPIKFNSLFFARFLFFIESLSETHVFETLTIERNRKNLFLRAEISALINLYFHIPLNFSLPIKFNFRRFWQISCKISIFP